MTIPQRRVHFITSNIYSVSGGSEILWQKSIDYLIKCGVLVSVSIPDIAGSSKLCILLRKKNVKVSFYPVEKNLLQRLFFKILEIVGFNFFYFHLKFIKSDLVVINQGGCSDGIEWMTACVRLKRAFVTISQAVRERLACEDLMADRILEIFPHAEKHFFVSQGNIDLFSRQVQGYIGKSCVVHNPSSLSRRHVVPWPKSSDILRLACVARLEILDKGQDLLFEVLARPIWRARPIEVSIVGSGSCQRILTRMKDRLGLTSVSFCGHIEDIECIWRTHHALVLPSRSEGFPLALIEAMWCGRPAIVSPVGDNHLVIENGYNGWLMKEICVSSLSEALENAWEGREEWEAWGRNAHQRISQYAPSAPAENFSETLLELL